MSFGASGGKRSRNGEETPPTHFRDGRQPQLVVGSQAESLARRSLRDCRHKKKTERSFGASGGNRTRNDSLGS